MVANRSRDTGPELAVRRAVHRRGFRYRVNAEPWRGMGRRADLVFRPVRTAVFVDGCYWHGCPEHGTQPATNRQFWAGKVRRNQERDRETDARLAEAGWTVLRVWEHEDAEEAAERIAATVRAEREERRR